MLDEQIKDLGGYLADVLVILPVILLHEIVHQTGDVGTAFSQRRQVNRYHIEPVEQVLTESALLNLLLELPACCGDHPHVDVNGLCSADRLELLFL